MTPSMNTYWGILWKMVDMADVVVQVVDARFPSICRSNRLEDKVREMENKNLLVVLNKTDLISREKLNQWITLQWLYLLKKLLSHKLPHPLQVEPHSLEDLKGRCCLFLVQKHSQFPALVQH